jgi:hypothetical protein
MSGCFNAFNSRKKEVINPWIDKGLWNVSLW